MPTNNVPPYLIFYPVKGKEGANAYQVGPGQKALLIDSEEAVIYVKSTNAFGQPYPLEEYDLVLRNPPAAPEVPSAVMSKDDIEAEIDRRVKDTLQKYFPQLNFNS